MLKIFKKESRKVIRVFTHPTFIFLTVTGNIFLLLATALVYFFERGHNPNMKSYFDCFWWGVSTVTTIGYGDILPVTVAGRIVGIMLMYTGTVMFISFTGILVSFMLHEEVEREFEKEFKKEEQEQKNIERALEHIHRRLEHIEKNVQK